MSRLVEELEYAQAQAEAGEIRSMVIITDTYLGFVMEPGADIERFLGRLTAAQFEIMGMVQSLPPGHEVTLN